MEELRGGVAECLGAHDPQWIERKTDNMVSCGTAQKRGEILAMGNWRLRGVRLGVVQAEPYMTAGEIFKFVGDRLQAKEKAYEYDRKAQQQTNGQQGTHPYQPQGRGCGKGYRGSRPILAVDVQPESAQSSQSSRGGGSPRPSSPGSRPGNGKSRYQSSRPREGRAQSAPAPRSAERGDKNLGKGAPPPRSEWATVQRKQQIPVCYAFKHAGYQSDHDHTTCEWSQRAKDPRSRECLTCKS